MSALDFRRAAGLFLASEEELARALGITVELVRRYRRSPEQAPEEVMRRLAHVLEERGRGMIRVGEMIADESR